MHSSKSRRFSVFFIVMFQVITILELCSAQDRVLSNDLDNYLVIRTVPLLAFYPSTGWVEGSLGACNYFGEIGALEANFDYGLVEPFRRWNDFSQVSIPAAAEVYRLGQMTGTPAVPMTIEAGVFAYIYRDKEVSSVFGFGDWNYTANKTGWLVMGPEVGYFHHSRLIGSFEGFSNISMNGLYAGLSVRNVMKFTASVDGRTLQIRKNYVLFADVLYSPTITIENVVKFQNVYTPTESSDSNLTNLGWRIGASVQEGYLAGFIEYGYLPGVAHYTARGDWKSSSTGQYVGKTLSSDLQGYLRLGLGVSLPL